MRQKIIGNISNTMTDRAIVNHATVNLVNQSWDKSLNELNFHLHPLDTIASSCLKNLKNTQDGETSRIWGSDCVASKIVWVMNKLRYRDGKGDPKNFETFLTKKELPKGLLPRYRGNRLHILYHICGQLIEHHNIFLDFLTNGPVNPCGGLTASLKEDFSSDLGKRQMGVLAMIGKMFSGPWMKRFYNSNVDHIAGIQTVKNNVEAIEITATNPLSILHATYDFFGDELVDDGVLISGKRYLPADDTTSKIITACFSAILDTLKRQYEKYFNLYITEQLKTETKSARAHNIDAEEAMGMFSASKQRAPNATIQFF